MEHLSASYGPGNMTWEEHRAFVDDLCGYGVLKEEDKDFISCEKDPGAMLFDRVRQVLAQMGT